MKDLIKQILGIIRYQNDKYLKHFMFGAILYMTAGIVLVGRGERVAATVVVLFAWEIFNCWLHKRPFMFREWFDIIVGIGGMYYAWWII